MYLGHPLALPGVTAMKCVSLSVHMMRMSVTLGYPETPNISVWLYTKGDREKNSVFFQTTAWEKVVFISVAS